MRRKIVIDADLKVIVKFKEGNYISTVGFSGLTNGLKKAFGEIELARLLRDGRLLFFLAFDQQRGKILKAQSVCKKDEVRVFGDRGVISGIPINENLEEIKKSIKGGTVVEIK